MPLRLRDLCALTVQSLKSNPLRSTLTTLGMFMGVAAVTATMHVRSISQAVIAAELAQRDAPQIGIGIAWVPRRDRLPLKAEELDFLRPRLVGLRALAAVNWAGTAHTVFQGAEADPGLTAVSIEFQATDGMRISAGRYFTPADYEKYRPVALIDQFLADRLFKGQNPIGQRIQSRGRPLFVIGVFPTKKAEDEPKGSIFIPLPIYSAMTGDKTVDAIQVRPADLRNLETLGEQAKQLIKQSRPGRQVWDFNNAEDIVEQQRTLDMASQALAVVAVISLLIGGVGIANVMIAAVTERTPEIGLRRAIGATKRDVMLQFLLEAATLSVVGGAAALGTVHGLTQLVALQFDLPYSFDGSTGILAISSALIVGVGAGFPPALRASQLDPIKALRAE
jgi:putative ABC transport system permease protein